MAMTKFVDNVLFQDQLDVTTAARLIGYGITYMLLAQHQLSFFWMHNGSDPA
jgi:hypothetical protein